MRRKSWGNLSITTKLYVVVGVMALLIGAELLILRFAMRNLSAVRAFVSGEGLWSKAQKNALLSLQRFGATRDERDFSEFARFLEVPLGDRRARLEMEKPAPDPAVIREGFIAGHIHPDDIDAMVGLIRRFNHISYIHRAISEWTEGDRLMQALEGEADLYRRALLRRPVDEAQVARSVGRIRALNDGMTAVSDRFSAALGEGSRWLERLVISILFVAVMMVEAVGLTLAFVTSRRISRGLADLNRAADRIGGGDFSTSVAAQSRDEIGQLGEGLNRMGGMLRASYEELEGRVRARTESLNAMAIENQRLYEEAKAAVQARDEFLSIASHELRTPMAAIFLKLQLLPRLVDSGALDKVKHTANTALQQSRRLARLVDELLDLTRIRAGKMKLSLEPSDLVALVADAVTELAGEAQNAGSVVRMRASGPVTATVDPTRLRQVIANLLSNAIKYGQGRPIDVEVRALAGGGTGSPKAEIAVVDRGAGIAPEDVERIFRRFERANDDLRITGLGLGLYISQQIVSAHGGALEVRSRPGEGSTFTVRV